MIRSGLKVPTPEIPMPDFAVPYAAPIAFPLLESFRITAPVVMSRGGRTSKDHGSRDASHAEEPGS